MQEQNTGSVNVGGCEVGVAPVAGLVLGDLHSVLCIALQLELPSYLPFLSLLILSLLSATDITD